MIMSRVNSDCDNKDPTSDEQLFLHSSSSSSSSSVPHVPKERIEPSNISSLYVQSMLELRIPRCAVCSSDWCLDLRKKLCMQFSTTQDSNRTSCAKNIVPDVVQNHETKSQKNNENKNHNKKNNEKEDDSTQFFATNRLILLPRCACTHLKVLSNPPLSHPSRWEQSYHEFQQLLYQYQHDIHSNTMDLSFLLTMMWKNFFTLHSSPTTLTPIIRTFSHNAMCQICLEQFLQASEQVEQQDGTWTPFTTSLQCPTCRQGYRSRELSHLLLPNHHTYRIFSSSCTFGMDTDVDTNTNRNTDIDIDTNTDANRTANNKNKNNNKTRENHPPPHPPHHRDRYKNHVSKNNHSMTMGSTSRWTVSQWNDSILSTIQMVLLWKQWKKEIRQSFSFSLDRNTRRIFWKQYKKTEKPKQETKEKESQKNIHLSNFYTWLLEENDGHSSDDDDDEMDSVEKKNRNTTRNNLTLYFHRSNDCSDDDNDDDDDDEETTEEEDTNKDNDTSTLHIHESKSSLQRLEIRKGELWRELMKRDPKFREEVENETIIRTMLNTEEGRTMLGMDDGLSWKEKSKEEHDDCHGTSPAGQEGKNEGVVVDLKNKSYSELIELLAKNEEERAIQIEKDKIFAETLQKEIEEATSFMNSKETENNEDNTSSTTLTAAFSTRDRTNSFGANPKRCKKRMRKRPCQSSLDVRLSTSSMQKESPVNGCRQFAQGSITDRKTSITKAKENKNRRLIKTKESFQDDALDEEALNSMIEMGFQADSCREALRDANYDMALAISILCSYEQLCSKIK